MRHRKQTFKIGRTSSHRRSMMANLACSLIMEGQVRTTLVKAKELRRLVERMITLGKRGTLHARRQAIAILKHPAVVHQVFSEIAPRFAARQGGYTRILKLGQRLGDAADFCLIQILSDAPAAATEPVAVAAVEATPATAAEPAETPAVEKKAKRTPKKKAETAK